MSISPNSDTFRHTHMLKEQMLELLGHMRDEVDKVTEPRARSMFETSAEVLTGLVRAFDDFENKDEAAWRESWGSGELTCKDSEL